MHLSKTEKNVVRQAKGTLIGAAVGAVLSPAAATIYAALDTVAPVSYPIMGAIAGVCAGYTARDGEPQDMVIGGALGFLGGVVSIPLAPLNFTTRPITTPMLYTSIGGAIGFFATK